MKKYFILFISIVFYTQGIAQVHLFEEFRKKVEKTYAENAFSLKMKVSVNAGGAKLEQYGEVKKSEYGLYTKYSNFTSLTNKNYKVKIDNNQKYILVEKAESNTSFDFSSLIQLSLDTSILKSVKITRQTDANGYVTYHFNLSKIDSPINLMSFTLNSNGTLHRVVYDYDESQTGKQGVSSVVIDYYETSLGAQFKASDFSESEYLKISSEKIQPNKNYSNYSLKLI